MYMNIPNGVLDAALFGNWPDDFELGAITGTVSGIAKWTIDEDSGKQTIVFNWSMNANYYPSHEFNVNGTDVDGKQLGYFDCRNASPTAAAGTIKLGWKPVDHYRGQSSVIKEN